MESLLQIQLLQPKSLQGNGTATLMHVDVLSR